MWGAYGMGCRVTKKDNGSSIVSKSVGLKDKLWRNKSLSFEEERIATSQFRPFTRQFL